ncbi:MAG: hypothetical protein BHW48_14865 [Roseburia sp. CAG:10041_57]|nr:MAG: hypothetical protein BHW48_14865 [Roseburia sp. CAG:10041_57]
MFLPILMNLVPLRDRHEDSFLDKCKSFFHRKMLCRDYHNGIHGVWFYLFFVIERETRSFVKLYNFIPESECLLITNSEESMLDCEGISIEVVPVWKWLLQFSMNNKNEDYV